MPDSVLPGSDQSPSKPAWLKAMPGGLPGSRHRDRGRFGGPDRDLDVWHAMRGSYVDSLRLALTIALTQPKASARWRLAPGSV